LPEHKTEWFFKERAMLKQKTVVGPNTYTTGGFTVTFDEFERVTMAMVKASMDDLNNAAIGGAVDTQYALRVTFATNVVTIQVYTCIAGAAWAQMVTATFDLRTVTFTVIADCD
jgi:hypothetical protein